MPDILFRGMELPAKPTAITIMPNGDIYDFFVDTKYGTAVELPAHGSLIDRDAIPYKKIMFDDDDFYYGVTQPYIDRMPVIVPASEEEKT